MADVDAVAGPKAKRKPEEEPEDIGTVADFIELVNTTVGKHFKCCICFRSVCVCLGGSTSASLAQKRWSYCRMRQYCTYRSRA